jgi:hypothetical protein
LVLGSSFKDDDLPTGEYIVIDRILIKDGESNFMKIILKHNESGKRWETKIELP